MPAPRPASPSHGGLTPRNPLFLASPLVLASIIVLIGAGLRVWASFSLFWLDEVLTLAWPRENSYWDLLTSARHDNNHVLNSMFMKLVGEPSHWIYYRLLSIITGTIAVGCMGWIGWRRGPAEGLIATILGATTYVLIHYSSEARGYGPLSCFALLSFMAIYQATRRPGWLISVAFWFTTVLGVLAHSTYAFAYIGIAAWSLVVWFPKDTRRCLELSRLHAVPMAVLTLVYFGRIRGMAIGGGPEFDLLRVAVNALSHCLGWRVGDWRGYLAASVVIGVAATEICKRARERHQKLHDDQSWVFYGTLLLATPLLIRFVLEPRIIYMRYVLVCMPFILLLMSGSLARCWRHGTWGRYACGVALALIVTLNATRVRGLLMAGRGQYLKALQYIESHDPAPVLEITGNNHLHVHRLLDYYKRFLDKPVAYAHPKHWQGRAPRWLIHDIQRFEARPPKGQELTSDTGWGRYVCVARFHYNSQSGANWYVFEHMDYR